MTAMTPLQGGLGLALALLMHATYEVTASPDVYGYIMGTLLLSFCLAATPAFSGTSTGSG